MTLNVDHAAPSVHQPGATEPLDRAGRAAVLLLLGGTLAFFLWRGPGVLAMPIGIICAWLSTRWRRRDKVVATGVVVVLWTLPFVLAVTVAKGWGFGVLVLLFLWPAGGLLAGVYLLLTRSTHGGS